MSIHLVTSFALQFTSYLSNLFVDTFWSIPTKQVLLGIWDWLFVDPGGTGNQMILSLLWVSKQGASWSSDIYNPQKSETLRLRSLPSEVPWPQKKRLPLLGTHRLRAGSDTPRLLSRGRGGGLRNRRKSKDPSFRTLDESTLTTLLSLAWTDTNQLVTDLVRPWILYEDSCPTYLLFWVVKTKTKLLLSRCPSPDSKRDSH